ncbi:MAG TPA: histidine--tRNA ligase, partial [Thermococcus paralvinellae]|nr:histidine--tRNA ligase [Thermococcus paralvinellae]
KAEYDLQGRKLRKALEYADKLEIPLVIIIGKRDLAEGKVTIRDMATGEQKSVPIERIVEEVKEMLG